MSLGLETAQQEWTESHRRLEGEARDPARYEALMQGFEAITAQLRRRIGHTFTLAELAEAYAGAERWSRDAVAASGAPAGWARSLALVEGAAFHAYARGAVDYAP